MTAPSIQKIEIEDDLASQNQGAIEVTITLSDDGTPGNSRSRIDSTLAEEVTFTNPTSRLRINAGAGDDFVNVTGLDSHFSADLTLDANNGSDQINLNGVLDFAGSLTAVANGAISVNSSITTNGNAVTITAGGLLSVDDALIQSTGGDITLNADDVAIITAGASIDAGAGSVTIRPTSTGR